MRCIDVNSIGVLTRTHLDPCDQGECYSLFSQEQRNNPINLPVFPSFLDLETQSRIGLTLLNKVNDWIHSYRDDVADCSIVPLEYFGDDLPLPIDLEQRKKVVEARAHYVIFHVHTDDCSCGRDS